MCTPSASALTVRARPVTPATHPSPCPLRPRCGGLLRVRAVGSRDDPPPSGTGPASGPPRSEEHTSELQSRGHLVCRLLLEKKNRTADSSHRTDRGTYTSEIIFHS